MENQKAAEEYHDVVNKALEHIMSNIGHFEDNYSLAMATYAFYLANHKQKDLSLMKLHDKAVKTETGYVYWTIKEREEDEEFVATAEELKATAYALKSFLATDRISDAVPIVKWLVTQRNAYGGFLSTQDTVVGLQALSEVATKIQTANDVKIVVKPDIGDPITFNIETNNSLILQSHLTSPDARHLKITTSGTVTAIIEMYYSYSTKESNKTIEHFNINATVEPTSNEEFLHLNVCTSFVPDKKTNKSNMAVMNIQLPTGFKCDWDYEEAIESIKNIKVSLNVCLEYMFVNIFLIIKLKRMKRTPNCSSFSITSIPISPAHKLKLIDHVKIPN